MVNTLTKVGLTAAVALAGAGFLVYSSVDNAQHYMKVDVLLTTDLTKWGDTVLQIHGNVEPGSIVEKVIDQQMHRSFVLVNEGARIRVFSVGPKPDTFEDHSEVVATGQLVPRARDVDLAHQLGVRAGDPDIAYVLDATDLSAKCPSRYGAKIKLEDLDTKFSER
jgi:cytochrome c-type biogenesis protein CcmE